MKINIITDLFILLIFVIFLFIDKTSFAIILSLLAIISLRELLTVRTGERKIPKFLMIISCIIVVFLVINNYDNSKENFYIDYKIITVLILSSFIPLVIINDKKKYNIVDVLFLIGSTLFIGITFNLLFQYRMYDRNYVNYIIIISFTTSFVEHLLSFFIGKTMFSPKINPKKTIEGIIGGLIIGTMVSTTYFISTITTGVALFVIVFITFLLTLSSQIGDLVFTFIKKEFNKSNFSNYNSKIGGILDIINSVVFVTITFILFVSFL